MAVDAFPDTVGGVGSAALGFDSTAVGDFANVAAGADEAIAIGGAGTSATGAQVQNAGSDRAISIRFQFRRRNGR